MIDKELLRQAIAVLPAGSSDVQSVQVATLDGIAIVHVGIQDDASNRVAAMTSSALGLGKRMIETVRAGQLDQISVAGSDGQIFVYAVADQAVLVIVTKKSPNIALVNWEARKVLAKLADLFGG